VSEILEAFLVQFYDNKTAPKNILLSNKIENPLLVENLLSKNSSYKIKILNPKYGEKAILVENARRNAEEALARKNSESANQIKLLKDLAKALNIERKLNRIEVYDNSHIQGTNAIGGMIVSGPDGLEKSAYRKFNIKEPTAQTGDDLAMMKEVIQRRFSKLLSENTDQNTENWPDLIIIDGGAGQVSAVAEVLRDLGITDLYFIGVAKGEERDAGKELFYRYKEKPFSLRHTDPVLYFVQRLRDEAHRFAIGAHRAKRKKSNFRSPLDEIKGVGHTRKRALLSHFGSAKAISRADLKDLQAVDGISNKLAKSLHDFFHDAS
jgi:excinuclease ABC subunit C